MSINAKEAEILEEFELFEDWQDKFGYVIECGRSLPPLDDSLKTEENRVHGCQNKVYIDSSFDGERINFAADSEAQIPRGLLSILVRVLGNEKPEDVVKAPLDFIDQAGIRDNLSMQRSNGLEAMIKRLKMEAMKYINA
jgi:cysteine desulfuration protein SufE